MYQVTFSQQSSLFFKELPQARQLKLIEALGALSPSILEEAKEPIGCFKRAETTYYRYRVEDFRFYFTLKGDTIHCTHVLSKNTWADYRLRNNLEKLSDAEIEAIPNFLNQLENHK